MSCEVFAQPGPGSDFTFGCVGGGAFSGAWGSFLLWFTEHQGVRLPKSAEELDDKLGRRRVGKELDAFLFQTEKPSGSSWVNPISPEDFIPRETMPRGNWGIVVDERGFIVATAGDGAPALTVAADALTGGAPQPTTTTATPDPEEEPPEGKGPCMKCLLWLLLAAAAVWYVARRK